VTVVGYISGFSNQQARALGTLVQAIKSGDPVALMTAQNLWTIGVDSGVQAKQPHLAFLAKRINLAISQFAGPQYAARMQQAAPFRLTVYFLPFAGFNQVTRLWPAAGWLAGTQPTSPVMRSPVYAAPIPYHRQAAVAPPVPPPAYLPPRMPTFSPIPPPTVQAVAVPPPHTSSHFEQPGSWHDVFRTEQENARQMLAHDPRQIARAAQAGNPGATNQIRNIQAMCRTPGPNQQLACQVYQQIQAYLQ
jgi:hypothetical protein